MTTEELKEKFTIALSGIWDAVKSVFTNIADEFKHFWNHIIISTSANRNSRAKKAYRIYMRTKNKRIKNKQMKIMREEFYKHLARGLVNDRA